MQREEAIREWAIQKMLEIKAMSLVDLPMDTILENAQKLVDFVTEKSSKPNMP